MTSLPKTQINIEPSSKVKSPLKQPLSTSLETNNGWKLVNLCITFLEELQKYIVREIGEEEEPALTVCLVAEKIDGKKWKILILEILQQVRISFHFPLIFSAAKQRTEQTLLSLMEEEEEEENSASLSRFEVRTNRGCESCDNAAAAAATPALKNGRISGPTRRSKKGGGWTVEEDKILVVAVKKYNGKHWKKVASNFPHKTDVQCLHRWQKVLDPNLVKGPWTKQEDDLIVQLVEQQGKKKWSRIAMHLPGRIGKQCRERGGITI